MKILLIFKTHLDLGYTDLAANVERRYMTEMIPHALSLAEQTKGKFIWTTGAWLIERFLQSSDENRRLMEDAIAKGYIAWHGLPMTMHAEIMDGELYEYGLSVAKRLDEKYGKNTVSAKSTDVPGMTRAVVPYLARAGISLLHIGVNPFSTVPDVPNIFYWQAPTGERVTVIYDGSYGDAIMLPGTDTMLYFAMTGDNLGPQTPDEVYALYEDLQARHPDAEIHAGTLDEAAELLRAASPDLPVITAEIGDSWAYGYQADPGKENMFRAMLRYVKTLPLSERNKAYEHLLLVAEHTCGVCGKKFLDDDGHYTRAEFESRRSLPNYRFCESSWTEQRDYITAAADALSPEYRDGAYKVMSEYRTVKPDLCGEAIPLYRDMYAGEEITLGRFSFMVGADGALYGLSLDGEELAPSGACLFSFAYTVYGAADVLRFCEQYGRERLSWGYDDFAKRGLETAGVSRTEVRTVADSVTKNGDSVTIKMHCEEYFHEKYGCPASFYLTVTADGDRLNVDFAWFDKPALRIPEGLTLTFANPMTDGALSVRKLGEWIDPKDVVSLGGRALHGTDFGIRIGGLEIESPDCSLVSFGGGIWTFDDRLPDDKADAVFRLYNNQWNTNFPFWYDEDARFRFIVKKR